MKAEFAQTSLLISAEEYKRLIDRNTPIVPQLEKQALDRGFKVFECPSCSHTLNEKVVPNYCEHCGQALDWDTEEEQIGNKRVYTKREIKKAKRFLTEMRDNCVPHETDTYDDPKREIKRKSLTIALDGLSYLPVI